MLRRTKLAPNVDKLNRTEKNDKTIGGRTFISSTFPIQRRNHVAYCTTRVVLSLIAVSMIINIIGVKRLVFDAHVERDRKNLHEITAKLMEHRRGYHDAKEKNVDKSAAKEMEVRQSVTDLVLDAQVDVGRNKDTKKLYEIAAKMTKDRRRERNNAKYGSIKTDNNERDKNNFHEIAAKMMKDRRGHLNAKTEIVGKSAAKEKEGRRIFSDERNSNNIVRGSGSDNEIYSTLAKEGVEQVLGSGGNEIQLDLHNNNFVSSTVHDSHKNGYRKSKKNVDNIRLREKILNRVSHRRMRITHGMDHKSCEEMYSRTLRRKRDYEETESEDPSKKICPGNSNAFIPSEIIIRGERHSGTNWISDIIRKNRYDVKILRDPYLTGWKHGFLKPHEFGFMTPLKENHLLLVVTRDIFMWLPKFHRTTYCNKAMKGKQGVNSTTFSEFIRNPYQCECQPTAKQMDMPERCLDYMKKCTGIMESAPNPIQLRTAKYKNWLQDIPIGSHPPFFDFGQKSANIGSSEIDYNAYRYHLRYESLLEDSSSSDNKSNVSRQEKVIKEMMSRHCINQKSRRGRNIDFSEQEFQPILSHISYSAKKNRIEKREATKFSALEEMKEMLKVYTREDIKFVLEQIDSKFEAEVLGYTYDYVKMFLD